MGYSACLVVEAFGMFRYAGHAGLPFQQSRVITTISSLVSPTTIPSLLQHHPGNAPQQHPPVQEAGVPSAGPRPAARLRRVVSAARPAAALHSSAAHQTTTPPQLPAPRPGSAACTAPPRPSAQPARPHTRVYVWESGEGSGLLYSSQTFCLIVFLTLHRP